MCGLFGTFNAATDNRASTKNRDSFLQKAAYLSAFRGIDGTGIAVAGNGRAQIYKEPVATWTFLQTYQFKDVIAALTDNNVVIGHARSKTVGPAIYTNTHPFRANHIVLAHNGTLTNTWTLSKTSQGITDSELIAQLMAAEGEKETLEKLEGSYALTWYNEQKGTFNIARNEARTIWSALDEAKNVMYYMSDPDMLRYAMWQAGIPINKKVGIRQVATGTWYVWSDKTTRWVEQTFVIKKSPVYTRPNYGGEGGYYRGEGVYASNFGQHQSGPWLGAAAAAIAADNKVVALPPPAREAGNTSIKKVDEAGFSIGTRIFIEIDEHQDGSKGMLLRGTAIIDPAVVVVAARQPIKENEVEIFYEAVVVGQSNRHNKITLFVDDLVAKSEDDVYDKTDASDPAVSRDALKCGHCDAPIKSTDVKAITWRGACAVGPCCKDKLN